MSFLRLFDWLIKVPKYEPFKIDSIVRLMAPELAVEDEEVLPVGFCLCELCPAGEVEPNAARTLSALHCASQL